MFGRVLTSAFIGTLRSAWSRTMQSAGDCVFTAYTPFVTFWTEETYNDMINRASFNDCEQAHIHRGELKIYGDPDIYRMLNLQRVIFKDRAVSQHSISVCLSSAISLKSY